jgi:hypothetical protein
MQGEEERAFLKISLIAFSDSPTHFDNTSGPRTKMIFMEPSFAKDFASRVLPHPEGPNINAPLAGFIPIFENFSGDMIGDNRFSLRRLFSLTRPPTSSQVIFVGST